MKILKTFSAAGNGSDPTAWPESMLHLCLPPDSTKAPSLFRQHLTVLSEQFSVSELKGIADGLASYQS